MNLKTFWAKIHQEQEEYWLTGSTLYESGGYDYYHKLPDLRDKVMLEIGVGKGIATRELSHICREVYAVDIVQEALDRVSDCAQTFLTEHFDHIETSIIDFGICHLVLQHCDDEMVQDLLRHAIRTLKPTGTLSLQVAHNDNPSGFEKEKYDEGLLYFRPLRIFQQWITAAGGHIVEQRGPQSFPDHDNISWHILRVQQTKSEITKRTFDVIV